MNLHILFCPAQTIAADGGPLPTASLALTLDDEVQYRCAGFVQAEIERYAEELDVDSATAAREESDEGETTDEESQDNEPASSKKGKDDKGKKSRKDSVSGM